MTIRLKPSQHDQIEFVVHARPSTRWSYGASTPLPVLKSPWGNIRFQANRALPSRA